MYQPMLESLLDLPLASVKLEKILNALQKKKSEKERGQDTAFIALVQEQADRVGMDGGYGGGYCFSRTSRMKS
jgi:hypothetical protein